MNNEEKLNSINNRIIEQISGNMKSYGFPKTIGHVIAIIHYEDKPMNLDELAEKTGMSKTKMSQVLREMVNLNIVEKFFIKGSRKDTYTVEQDYYQTFLSLFTHNWKNFVTRNKLVEEKIIQDLNDILDDKNATPSEIEKAQAYYDDRQKSLDFFDWVDRLVEVFESHEIFDLVPKSKSKTE